MAANIRQVHSLVAFNTVLTWFKTVKYISIIPYVTTFMQTVSISQVNLGLSDAISETRSTCS